MQGLITAAFLLGRGKFCYNKRLAGFSNLTTCHNAVHYSDSKVSVNCASWMKSSRELAMASVATCKTRSAEVAKRKTWFSG